MVTIQTGSASEFIGMIKSRRSCRSFRSDPVPKEALQQILEAAINAPSWANTQPWGFTVVGGELLKQLKSVMAQAQTPEPSRHSDLPFPVFPEKYQERARKNGAQLYAALGIVRDDAARRAEHQASMGNLFGAPSCIVVHVDKELGPYAVLDAGLAMQNLLLAAHSLGLGTCPLAYVAREPGIVRRMLGIPGSQAIICGIAVGYPDSVAPANRHRSEREPLESFVTWRDVD